MPYPSKAPFPTIATTSSAPAHNTLPPPSAQVAARSSRIAPHSHIKGLGLNVDGLSATNGAGFRVIGQTNAREVSLLWRVKSDSMAEALRWGVRCCGRSRQIAQILWMRTSPRRSPWDGKNSPCTCHFLGAGCQDTIMSYGRFRGV